MALSGQQNSKTLQLTNIRHYRLTCAATRIASQACSHSGLLRHGHPPGQVKKYDTHHRYHSSMQGCIASMLAPIATVQACLGVGR